MHIYSNLFNLNSVPHNFQAFIISLAVTDELRGDVFHIGDAALRFVQPFLDCIHWIFKVSNNLFYWWHIRRYHLGKVELILLISDNTFSIFEPWFVGRVGDDSCASEVCLVVMRLVVISLKY